LLRLEVLVGCMHSASVALFCSNVHRSIALESRFQVFMLVASHRRGFHLAERAKPARDARLLDALGFLEQLGAGLQGLGDALG
jgi:hypothetical protein